MILLACAPRHEPPPPPPSRVGVVHSSAVPAGTERDAILRVLNGAAAAPCYEAGLGRNPGLHGEVVVRFRIAAAGPPEELRTTFTTLADADVVRCVEDAVRALQFPAPSRPGISVTYPFLFTSEGTPPEVVRALQLRYGLVPEDIGEVADPKTPVPPGVVLVW